MRTSLILGFLLLAGCGGRVAMPVAATNSFDDRLSCAHLAAEHQANARRVTDLAGERGEKARDNVGLLLASPLFLDFSSTIKDELKAIDTREKVLGELAVKKNCPPFTLTASTASQ